MADQLAMAEAAGARWLKMKPRVGNLLNLVVIKLDPNQARVAAPSRLGYATTAT